MKGRECFAGSCATAGALCAGCRTSTSPGWSRAWHSPLQRRRFRINRIRAAGLSGCRRRGQLSSPTLLFNPARHRVRALCAAGSWGGQGWSNCQTLFGLDKIPSDNHVRTLLDPVSPDHFHPVFAEVVSELERSDGLEAFRQLGGHVLIALDGTEYHVSG